MPFIAYPTMTLFFLPKVYFLKPVASKAAVNYKIQGIV